VTHMSRVRFVRTAAGPAVRAAALLRQGKARVEDTTHGRHIVADFRGRCTDPWTLREVQGSGDSWLCTDVIVRCRKCTRCLKQRSREWIVRCIREMNLAPRTWFVTLTVKPDWRYKHVAMARARNVEHWDYLTDEQKHRKQMEELSRTITVWLKRFRMRSVRRAGADGRETPRIRYFVCLEEHPTSGEWHAHLLCHERAGQVREEDFRATWWPIGFAQAKLVRHPTRAAFYVAKYLSDSSGNRQRSSLKYGLAVSQPLKAA